MTDSYLPLNPFVEVSVGEDHFWRRSAWVDSPEIHAGAFEELCAVVDATSLTGRTQVCFVRGAGGSGKSHLFVRLQRKYADRILYAYAANPPLQQDAIEPWLLSKLIASLRFKARDAQGVEAPFSQLRMLAYVFLKPVIEQDLPVRELHRVWMEMPRAEQETLVRDAAHVLADDHPEMAEAIIQCLLLTLLKEKERLAAQWLSGGAYLSESHLETLGISEVLSRTDFPKVINLLGRLAKLAKLPLVCTLDQLDVAVDTPVLAELQKTIFGLIEESSGWSVLISVTPAVFTVWKNSINQALRGRIGMPDASVEHGYRLPVVDAIPIGAPEQKSLIEARLRLPQLEEKRRADGITSPWHPFDQSDFEILVTTEGTFPRTLLSRARDRFQSRLGNPAPLLPLSTAVEDLLEQMIAAQPAVPDPPSAVELGERLREIVQLLSPAPFQETTGDLRSKYARFDGFDTILEKQGRQIRLVTSHATRVSFITVLNRLEKACGDTVLVRYAGAPLSGKATLELLDAFKQRGNQVHFVSADQWKLISAAGSLLAGFREGNYSDLRTTPPPEGGGFLQTLKENPLLQALEFVIALLADPAPVSGPPPSPSLPPEPAPPPVPPANPAPSEPDANLPTTIRSIMQSHRWLEIRRLQFCLSSPGLTVPLPALREQLTRPPLSNQVSLHPPGVPENASNVQIVIWNDR